MPEPLSNKLARLGALLEGARRIANRTTRFGAVARARLVASTRLSAEGVELALDAHLETDPGIEELELLCASVKDAPRAHVLLSANVFTGAHRALALALASSERVCVRPSRRDPEFVALLAEQCPGLFSIVARVEPEAGESVWAYGTDATLAELHASLPASVALHAYGGGLGLAVVDRSAAASDAELARAAERLAYDVVVFDQRGCLSPRAVLWVGDAGGARELAAALAEALESKQAEVPLGRLDDDELADVAVYRDAAAYAGELLVAGRGFVGVGVEPDRLVVPPIGRNLHVVPVRSLSETLDSVRDLVTALGVEVSPSLRAEFVALVPRARVTHLGAMQKPPFDGPVDRRARRY
ncbi:MAG TPA: acyl-CoA reductase [Polyangiaceae bacterium]